MFLKQLSAPLLKMKNHFLLLLILLASFVSRANNYDLLKCEQFTIEDGLPQSNIETIFQDRKGFLWIATQDGVSKFNGYQFENFYSNPFNSKSILSNYVIKINNWRKDSICFTTTIGLSIFDPATKIFKNYPLSLQNKSIGKIKGSLLLKNKKILLISNKGLYEVDLSKSKNLVSIISNERGFNLIHQSKNQILITSKNHLFELKEKKLNILKSFNQNISSLFLDEKGANVMLGDSLIRFENNFTNQTSYGFPSNLNVCIKVDNDYWLGTANDGLFIFNPKKEEQIQKIYSNNRANNLLSQKVRSIFKDEFGIIWIGTDKGLNKIDLSKKQFLQVKPSNYSPKSSDNAWSFYENDSIFLSGLDNGLQVFNKASKRYQWIDFPVPILDIINYQNRLLLATGKGVFFLNKMDSLFNIDSIAINIIVDDKQDVVFKFLNFQNFLLIGSLNRLTICDQNLIVKKSWPLKNVRDFTVLNGKIYFAAYPTGIYKMINTENLDRINFKSKPLPEVEHLLSLSINSAENNIWLGLHGGGLVKYEIQQQKSSHFSTKKGLPNNTIYSIEKSSEALWLSTNGGLSKYSFKSQAFENFNPSDGLQSLEYNSGASYTNNNNDVYFGGINGYNIVRPAEGGINRTPPRAYISSVNYKGENLLELDSIDQSTNEKIIVIPHYRNSFSISVDALHFSSPKENIFKTKLEGWQTEWEIAKGKHIYNFSNLQEGDYYFILKVANPDGIWSYGEERIHIVIKPPFYLTWWFITIVSVLISSILFYSIYVRVNRAKIQRDLLEDKVKNRTLEVENQKRILEEKNRELEIEKNKEEEVLLNVLPRETARELVSTGKATPRSYKMATVMFADFKNFTKITENLGPKELVAELDDSFAKFDDIVGRLNIEKIKTSGDAYMCVGGVPIRNQTNPVDCVLAAFQFQKYMEQKRAVRDGTGKPQWHLRIGLHTGALVAGVVGKRKFLYDVWGDTVNTAARMETSAETGTINISGTTYEFIKDYFECEYRGKLPVKNKGAIDMYYVTRIKTDLCKDKEIGNTPNRKFFELLNFKVYTQQNFLNVRNYFIDLLEQSKFVSKLKYHGPHHTIDVMEAAERIGRSEGLSEEELMLVKVAALFHDSGFLNKYQNNEAEGANLAKRELPRYGFTDSQVEIVEGMILATKIPQDPKNRLEEVLCDADLDYLGRSKEEFDIISDSLAQELVDMKLLKNLNQWDPIQIKFLEAHKYFTKTCVKTRRAGKIERLREIKARLIGPNVE